MVNGETDEQRAARLRREAAERSRVRKRAAELEKRMNAPDDDDED